MKPSDNKLQKLKSLPSQGGFWYITKQNLIFRDLCFMAKMLEEWNDDNSQSYESFFNAHKELETYGGFDSLTAHRATKNCEYIGLMYSSNRYSAQNLTPYYQSIKKLCEGDFNKLTLYPSLVNKQLERMFVDSSFSSVYNVLFKINPFMFIFKILLLIGDITKSYKISVSEFKLFVATAQNWNDYFEVVESIIRYRNDSDFQRNCDLNKSKVNDVRYNILAQNHSQLEIVDSDMSIKDGEVKNVRKKVAEYELSDRFESSNDIYEEDNSLKHEDQLLQQIYYGAPGTGKSYEIDKDTNENNRIRTTFHPDYDYATFVGAYKPAAKQVNKYGLNGGSTVSMEVDGKTIKEDVIVYKFIPQVFIKAYVEAWKRHADAECTDKDFYLVIEEINRGNCAQIFGDLFQLLDRTSEGFSSYAVETESDLQNFLKEDEEYKLDITLTEDIKNDNGKVIATKENVMNGKVLVLPPNLHIWATMNTSDQSLFPIDSAFKRRWDWVYKPIKYNNTEWKIVLNNEEVCKWTELQQTLNNLIYEATDSEDKMLGDWFVKADSMNEINEDKLVGKIIFYLWNDVAKVDAGKLFDLEIEKKGTKRKVVFSDFYNIDGKVNTGVVRAWLKDITVLKTENAEDKTPNEPEQ